MTAHDRIRLTGPFAEFANCPAADFPLAGGNDSPGWEISPPGLTIYGNLSQDALFDCQAFQQKNQELEQNAIPNLAFPTESGLFPQE